jgi:hypothetical protein
VADASPPVPPLHSRAPDELITRRLLLAKGFYQRGDDLSRTGSDLDSMLAVHHLHLAVEVTLRAVASVLRVDLPKNAPFTQVLSEVDKASRAVVGGSRVPLMQEMLTLNNERNGVQHDAKLSHPAYARESSIRVRSFLGDVFTSFLASDFEALSEREFVVNPGLRTLLSHANRLAAADSTRSRQTAVALCRFCLDNAFRSVALRIHVRDDDELPPLRQYDRHAYRRLDVLEDEMALLATGVELLDYRWLYRSSPWVYVAKDGSVAIDVTHGGPCTANDCARAERFVIRCVLSWQRAELAPVYWGSPTTIEQFAELAQLHEQIDSALS